MIVPLNSTLISLDFSGNPVCDNLSYCSEVISIFPKLRNFDGKNLYEIFTSNWNKHSKFAFSFSDSCSIASSSIFTSSAFVDLDGETTFECRLRRALAIKFRGWSKKKVKELLTDSMEMLDSCNGAETLTATSTFSSGVNAAAASGNVLDQFLIDALHTDPEVIKKTIAPPSKPTEEVASYLKATNVSRSKRQSFLVTSRSWSPFKAMWVDDDAGDESISEVMNLTSSSSLASYMMKTDSSKSKRQSFIIAEKALKSLQIRQAQTPSQRPLSAGTIAYMKYTGSSKQKRKSFIDINKERCGSAPSRVRSPVPQPKYMDPTVCSRPRRMSYFKQHQENQSPNRRKSFIEVNIEQCAKSSKVKAMKRATDSPPKPTAAYMIPTQASRPKRLSYVSPLSPQEVLQKVGIVGTGYLNDPSIVPSSSVSPSASPRKRGSIAFSHSDERQISTDPQTVYCERNHTPFASPKKKQQPGTRGPNSPTSASSSSGSVSNKKPHIDTSAADTDRMAKRGLVQGLHGSAMDHTSSGETAGTALLRHVDNLDVLLAMGFSPQQGREALTAANNDLDTAINKLLLHPSPVSTAMHSALSTVPSKSSEPQTAEKPLHPRAAAMRPSQVSPKPSLPLGGLQNLFGRKSQSFIREDDLFAELSD